MCVCVCVCGGGGGGGGGTPKTVKKVIYSSKKLGKLCLNQSLGSAGQKGSWRKLITEIPAESGQVPDPIAAWVHQRVHKSHQCLLF